MTWKRTCFLSLSALPDRTRYQLPTQRSKASCLPREMRIELMPGSIPLLKNVLPLLFVIVLLSSHVYAQQEDLAFEPLPLDQGASTHVSCILQDRTGFIWIAAWSGLHRYDGYGFLSYKHDPDDSASLAVNTLSTLYEDRAGVLWIGSWGGLERFDRATGRFRTSPTAASGGGSLTRWTRAAPG